MRIVRRAAFATCWFSAAMAAGSAFAAAATQPASRARPLLSAADMAALKELGSSRYKRRKMAFADLRNSLIRQTNRLVVLQRVLLRVDDKLRAEIAALSMRAPTGQIRRRAQLLRFQAALCLWGASAVEIPNRKERRALLAWGSIPRHAAALAEIYSHRTGVRLLGIAAMRSWKKSPPDALLLNLLNDPNPAVSLSIIGMLWHKKLTPPLVAALWQMAAPAAQTNQVYQQPVMRVVRVHGTEIDFPKHVQNRFDMRLQQVTAAAGDLLIHRPAPTLRKRLAATCRALARSTGPNPYYFLNLWTNSYSPNPFADLLLRFKPKAAVRMLVKVATTAQTNGYDNVMPTGKVRFSNRIDALAMLATITKQNAGKYKLTIPFPQNGRWAVTGGMAAEKADLKLLKAWWKKHKARYTRKGRREKPKAAAATAPKAR